MIYLTNVATADVQVLDMLHTLLDKRTLMNGEVRALASRALLRHELPDAFAACLARCVGKGCSAQHTPAMPSRPCGQATQHPVRCPPCSSNL